MHPGKQGKNRTSWEICSLQRGLLATRTDRSPCVYHSTAQRGLPPAPLAQEPRRWIPPGVLLSAEGSHGVTLPCISKFFLSQLKINKWARLISPRGGRSCHRLCTRVFLSTLAPSGTRLPRLPLTTRGRAGGESFSPSCYKGQRERRQHFLQQLFRRTGVRERSLQL